MGALLEEAKKGLEEKKKEYKLRVIKDLLCEKEGKEKRIKEIDATITKIEESDWNMKYATE